MKFECSTPTIVHPVASWEGGLHRRETIFRLVRAENRYARRRDGKVSRLSEHRLLLPHLDSGLASIRNWAKYSAGLAKGSRQVDWRRRDEENLGRQFRTPRGLQIAFQNRDYASLTETVERRRTTRYGIGIIADQ